jgi:hypothetical protein
MGFWGADKKLPDGGVERIHYEEDGTPSGLREYANPRNRKSQAEMDQIYAGVNNGTECVRCGHGNCRKCDGHDMSPNPYTTRQGNGPFGLGRKGTVTNSVRCNCCGRVDHV